MPSSAFGADDLSASPPVLGPEYLDETTTQDADADEDEQAATSRQPVFIPTAGMPDEHGHAEIQLRRTDQDELALPVFTSVENLVACCGENQAWVAFHAQAVPDLLAATGATGFVQDVELPQETGESDHG